MLIPRSIFLCAQYVKTAFFNHIHHVFLAVKQDDLQDTVETVQQLMEEI